MSDSEESSAGEDNQGPQDKFWPYFDYIASPMGSKKEEEEDDYIAYKIKKDNSEKRVRFYDEEEDEEEENEEDDFADVLAIVAQVAQANPPKADEPEEPTYEPRNNDGY
jgi:hypothetical protein